MTAPRPEEEVARKTKRGTPVLCTRRGAMSTTVGVGIIGVGRRWPRWRGALEGLSDRFAVRALCDQGRGGAGRAAREIGAAAAAGPAELLARPDVEAVLLLARQWFGLWPLTLACQSRKPVL